MADGNHATGEVMRWFLIHCKPREDGRALEHLQRQGFECYRPELHVERRRQGRKCAVTEPLFPGYLFIHLDSVNDNWSPIRSTRGVHQIVRCNGLPVPVPDGVIAGIRAKAQGHHEQPYLKPGERVQIVGGAFRELEAIFVAVDGDERAILLLNLLQTEQAISFPLEFVRKIG